MGRGVTVPTPEKFGPLAVVVVLALFLMAFGFSVYNAAVFWWRSER
jgi:hypothetical protein